MKLRGAVVAALLVLSPGMLPPPHPPATNRRPRQARRPNS